MPRMLGTFCRPWCPSCRRPAGVDCCVSPRSKKAQRAKENREWRRDVTLPLVAK